MEDTIILSTPFTIKILRNVNLIDDEPLEIAYIIITKKMTTHNWKEIISASDPSKSYEEAVSSFKCDICKQKTSPKNPIYTNNEFIGVDICTQCMNESFKNGLKKEIGWIPGPVYKLSEIVKYATLPTKIAYQPIKKQNRSFY